MKRFFEWIMKLSKRLETIVSFINNEDKVLDVGCDHAYIDIYIALNKKNKLIIASDISKKVINIAKNNISKYKLENRIKIYQTPGTTNINDDYDTIIIAGMGSNTILDILKNTRIVKKLIISSNNNWDTIRKDICNLGYHISNEKLVFEKNKLYSVMVFEKHKKRISKKELLIGKYSKYNINEYNIYLKEIRYIYFKIPKSKVLKKLHYKYIIICLKRYLRKENR